MKKVTHAALKGAKRKMTRRIVRGDLYIKKIKDKMESYLSWINVSCESETKLVIDRENNRVHLTCANVSFSKLTKDDLDNIGHFGNVQHVSLNEDHYEATMTDFKLSSRVDALKETEPEPCVVEFRKGGDYICYRDDEASFGPKLTKADFTRSGFTCEMCDGATIEYEFQEIENAK